MRIDGVAFYNTELHTKHGLSKVFNICRHKDKNTGQSYIVFDTKKWKGVSPRKYKAICRKCLKEFILTEDEYKHYLDTGEIR